MEGGCSPTEVAIPQQRDGPRCLAVAVRRIWSWFFTPMRNRALPSRHITDCQMRLYMKVRQAEAPIIASAKAGFSASTGYRFEQNPAFPRTRTRRAAGVGRIL
jgi:hypothetical protein